MMSKMEKRENKDTNKVIDMQKKRAEQEMFKRIRKSLDKEKEPGVDEILQAVEKDDPSYLRRVK
jgi:hypothetical protein